MAFILIGWDKGSTIAQAINLRANAPNSKLGINFIIAPINFCAISLATLVHVHVVQIAR